MIEEAAEAIAVRVPRDADPREGKKWLMKLVVKPCEMMVRYG